MTAPEDVNANNINEQNLLQKMFSLATAVTTGERISDERILKRLQICSECPEVKVVGSADDPRMSCGICGCKISGDRTLNNLALYEESPRYGCKFRGGSKWKAAGV